MQKAFSIWLKFKFLTVFPVHVNTILSNFPYYSVNGNKKKCPKYEGCIPVNPKVRNCRNSQKHENCHFTYIG